MSARTDGASIPLDRLAALLSEKGHRITPSREVVIGAVALSEGTFTAARILDLTEAVAPDVGRATVFRTLDLLIGLGALERVRLPGGQEGYVLCGPPHHHHIVCSACGAVGEIDDTVLESALQDAVRRSGFTLEHHALELAGSCAACRQAGS